MLGGASGASQASGCGRRIPSFPLRGRILRLRGLRGGIAGLPQAHAALAMVAVGLSHLLGGELEGGDAPFLELVPVGRREEMYRGRRITIVRL